MDIRVRITNENLGARFEDWTFEPLGNLQAEDEVAQRFGFRDSDDARRQGFRVSSELRPLGD